MSPFPIQDDRRDESSVRPTRFAEYIGQQNVRERVEVCVRAALMRDEPLDHVLLSGPPGLGKTTLARIIAHEMGVNIFTTSGPALDRKGDLAGILTSLEPRDILFIDEIHRLNPAVEENLYPAMEEFTFDIIVGTGPGANTIRLPLNPFTLIGATTRTGLLTSPLRSRFGIVERLDLYNVPELVQIVMRSAEILHFELTEEGGTELGRRSRGTPRIVNRLLRRVSDYALVNDTPIIDLEVARHALEQLEIDEYGFDSTDRLLLSTLVNTFEGGPVGLDTLAAATGESSDAIEDVYEPYFIQLGFIQRTPRGRVATGRAFEYFGKSRPQGSGQGTIPLE
ncbi:MAG: Holliday junction branch migration DNA helicase RuvB [Bradymonadales bacterium]|nr:Holliday junction branch migration DNA helicase RuvB [Bradymonadales bacterium]